MLQGRKGLDTNLALWIWSSKLWCPMVISHHSYKQT